MKKLFENPIIKYVAFGVLYLIAALFVAFSVNIFAAIVANEFRYLLNYFPTIVALWMPLASACFLWMYWNSNNVASKWKIARMYGLVITAASFICLVAHILMISTEFGWRLYNNMSWLYPFDILALLVIFLGIGIYALISSFKNKAFRDVEMTQPVTKRRVYVAMWFAICMSAYYVGAGLKAFALMDHFDPNWWMMIPVILVNFLLAFSVGLYVWYKQGDEEDRKKRHFKAIVIILSTSAVLAIWILIGMLVNPYFFPQSLNSHYPLGYLIKMPIGLFIEIAGLIALYTVSIVKYAKGKKK